jgi:hypothetical protein
MIDPGEYTGAPEPGSADNASKNTLTVGIHPAQLVGCFDAHGAAIDCRERVKASWYRQAPVAIFSIHHKPILTGK